MAQNLFTLFMKNVPISLIKKKTKTNFSSIMVSPTHDQLKGMNRVDLLKLISDHFSMVEVRAICLNLNIEEAKFK